MSGGGLVAAMLRDLAEVVAAHRYRYADEVGLQDGIALVLAGEGFTVWREHLLGGQTADRIDFYLPDLRLGIEVKLSAPLSEVTRQLHRYAQAQEVEGLLLVTSSSRLGPLDGEVMAGKPVAVAVLWRQGL